MWSFRRCALPIRRDRIERQPVSPLFLLAALVIAAGPGPGDFLRCREYAVGRQAAPASRRRSGLRLAGFVHVMGGLRRLRDRPCQRRTFHAAQIRRRALSGLAGHHGHFARRAICCRDRPSPVARAQAFCEGVLVEALNPKTAAFFLAFIPQFVDPACGFVALQFITLRPDLGGAPQHACRCSSW